MRSGMAPRRGLGLWLGLLILAGLLVRAWRLSWQPLWWDEGYSVYFATESLSQMLWLTARDIHPPLYYALLHGWIALLGSAGPTVLRTLSIGFGLMALPLLALFVNALFPARSSRLPLLAALLLAISPMHLYYSQEVRMYGLAMTLGLAASIALWFAVLNIDDGRAAWPHLAAYFLLATLLLHTLYYGALLLAAHVLWLVWHFRHRPGRSIALILAYLAIALAYLPWILYAAPRLILYVDNKIGADNDTPLNALQYVSRHWLAFSGGHLVPASPWLWALTVVAAIAAAVALVATLRSGTLPGESDELSAPDMQPRLALWLFLLVPVSIGFILNLRLPFFPDGGERLMLLVLPYAVALVALGVDALWPRRWLGVTILVLLVAGSAVGVYVYYTTARYADHDYRPLIGQVVQAGKESDTVLATFPWQIGYWRAYTPQDQEGSPYAPQPVLPVQGLMEWGPETQRVVDDAIERGTLWFPAPLSFGSTLPQEVEAYLAENATNLENRWYSPATRLSAWSRLPEPERQPVQADLGAVRLLSAATGPTAIASANLPISISAEWEIVDPEREYSVTLRLQDNRGHTWASRDYAPLGSWSNADGSPRFVEQAGLLIPVGIPPGDYIATAGVGDGESDTLLALRDTGESLVEIGMLTVTAPAQPQAAIRLPIQHPMQPPTTVDGITLLGHAGATGESESHLAGVELSAALFFAADASALPLRHIYLNLLSSDGATVAGWEGWPLDGYPTTAWTQGALVQIPITFFLPATLSSGTYRLVAGLVDPTSGRKSHATQLGSVAVTQREAIYQTPSVQHPLDPVPQIGSHVELLGYDLARSADVLDLVLHWRVVQSLLPPHNVFVHADDATGQTVAQDDGPPRTIDGPAPTGSWRPGEYLSTIHRVESPVQLDAGEIIIKVGLYREGDNVRLPVIVDGNVVGDVLSLPPTE